MQTFTGRTVKIAFVVLGCCGPKDCLCAAQSLLRRANTHAGVGHARPCRIVALDVGNVFITSR